MNSAFPTEGTCARAYNVAPSPPCPCRSGAFPCRQRDVSAVRLDVVSSVVVTDFADVYVPLILRRAFQYPHAFDFVLTCRRWRSINVAAS